MEKIYRIALFLAGIINILPAFLAFIPDKISKSYGIELPNENFELLLRHRAILFGIIGGLMIYSAIAKKYYTIATSVGLISMVSFILLFFLIGKDINSELKNIMIVDIVASFILCLGLLLFKLRP